MNLKYVITNHGLSSCYFCPSLQPEQAGATHSEPLSSRTTHEYQPNLARQEQPTLVERIGHAVGIHHHDLKPHPQLMSEQVAPGMAGHRRGHGHDVATTGATSHEAHPSASTDTAHPALSERAFDDALQGKSHSHAAPYGTTTAAAAAAARDSDPLVSSRTAAHGPAAGHSHGHGYGTPNVYGSEFAGMSVTERDAAPMAAAAAMPSAAVRERSDERVGGGGGVGMSTGGMGTDAGFMETKATGSHTDTGGMGSQTSGSTGTGVMGAGTTGTHTRGMGHTEGAVHGGHMLDEGDTHGGAVAAAATGLAAGLGAGGRMAGREEVIHAIKSSTHPCQPPMSCVPSA